jgi:hypothetical protein
MNLRHEFIKECKDKEGCLLEFGTCTGNSAIFLAEKWWPNKVFTIDGFEGLPKTEKEAPVNWHEGAFRKDYHTIKQRLSPYNNIRVIHSWINELENPEYYNIGPVVGANVDVDIYESTRDSLNWLDMCEWFNDEVIIRFDDWSTPVGFNGATIEIIEKVALHNKLAYSEFLEKTGYKSEIIEEDEFVAVFKLKR